MYMYICMYIFIKTRACLCTKNTNNKKRPPAGIFPGRGLSKIKKIKIKKKTGFVRLIEVNGKWGLQ